MIPSRTCIKNLGQSRFFIMCACMDSNHGPPRYKLGALPTELQARIKILAYSPQQTSGPTLLEMNFVLCSMFELFFNNGELCESVVGVDEMRCLSTRSLYHLEIL